MLSQYTPQRSEALNKLNIPAIEQPVHFKVLWLDHLAAANVENRIRKDSHAHLFFELHFVFAGTICYECNGEKIELSENQALLIPSSVEHRYVHSGEGLLKASLAVAFSDVEQLPDVFRKASVTVFEFSDTVRENIDDILKHSESRDIFIPYLISGRILEILYAVYRSLNITLPVLSDQTTDPRLAVAKQYIKNNEHRMIGCKDVARECCLSPKQINRIFKNHTGRSLMEYLIDTRIKRAKKLLLQSEYSIKEIGYMLGFENESSFSSFFKRHCGTPPGRFRKQTADEEPT